MKFDKSKIYTELSADEVKVGSKGYFGNSLYELREQVRNNKPTSTLIGVVYKERSCEIFCRDDELETPFIFFYLVAEPGEEKWRPYKDTNEMIRDFLNRYNSYNDNCYPNNPMYNPLIWIRHKISNETALIMYYADGLVSINSIFASIQAIFEDYTYLDGSPCGIKES